jgi:hypothetical protein
MPNPIVTVCFLEYIYMSGLGRTATHHGFSFIGRLRAKMEHPALRTVDI